MGRAARSPRRRSRRAPGKILRGWGKPVWVRGDVELVGHARDAPRGRRPGASVRRAADLDPSLGVLLDGRDAGRARERVRSDRRRRSKPTPTRYGRDQRSDRRSKDASHPHRLVVLGLAIIPALARSSQPSSGSWAASGGRATTASTSRSRRPIPSRRSCRRSLRQGGEAGSYEFTATLFDLIRRGVYKAEPTTTERPIWGGLRAETVSDLELSAGKEQELSRRGNVTSRTSSTPCWTVGTRAAVAIPRPDRGRARDDAPSLHLIQGAPSRTRRTDASWFRSTRSAPTRHRHGSLRSRGRSARVPRCATTGAPCTRATPTCVLVGIGACLIANAALCLANADLQSRRVWRRRTTERTGRGRALGRVPALPLRLPAPAGSAARDARALGALPRLRHRVRDRRARAPGGAIPHARGPPRGELDLLDLIVAATSARAPTSLSIGDLASGFGKRTRATELGLGVAAAASRVEAAVVAAEAAEGRLAIGAAVSTPELSSASLTKAQASERRESS